MLKCRHCGSTWHISGQELEEAELRIKIPRCDKCGRYLGSLRTVRVLMDGCLCNGARGLPEDMVLQIEDLDVSPGDIGVTKNEDGEDCFIQVVMPEDGCAPRTAGEIETVRELYIAALEMQSAACRADARTRDIETAGCTPRLREALERSKRVFGF